MIFPSFWLLPSLNISGVEFSRKMSGWFENKIEAESVSVTERHNKLVTSDFKQSVIRFVIIRHIMRCIDRFLYLPSFPTKPTPNDSIGWSYLPLSSLLSTGPPTSPDRFQNTIVSSVTVQRGCPSVGQLTSSR